MHSLKMGLLAAALAASNAAAAIEPELGAEQILAETNTHAYIGAAYAYRFAQTFELHDTGELSHLMLPVACDPKVVLRVTIEEAPNGVPSGNIVAKQDVPGYVLDSVYTGSTVAMRMVEFTKPARLKPGMYAFTLSTKGAGGCALWRAPVGVPYAYYAYSSNAYSSAGWQVLQDGSGNPQFLAFQVYQRPV